MFYYQMDNVYQTNNTNNTNNMYQPDNVIIEELDESHDCVEYCKLLKQLTTIDPDHISVEKFKKRVRLISGNPYHKIIVAKINNTIVGTTTILIEPKFIHDLSFVAHIEDVVVDTTYRGAGIGKCLMKKAINISKDFDCYKIILDCSTKNVSYYEKLGFSVKETQMVYRLDNN